MNLYYNPSSKNMSFLKVAALCAVFFAIVAGNSMAQSPESKIKAIFIYNFTRHINWPESAGTFTIGIVGESDLALELEKIITNSQASSTRTVVIKKLANTQAVGNAQGYNILYFSANESSSIKSVSDRTGKAPVLFITEGSGQSRKGSTISFFRDDASKIKFELNKTALESHSMKASGDLLRLAVLTEN